MYNNFSLSLLKKYGWNEGEGLGKNSQGICKPVKANLKFNNLGVGYHEIAGEQDSKWANMYSSALSRISVEKDSTVKVVKDETEDNLYKLGYTALSKGFRKSDLCLKDGIEINISNNVGEKKKSKKKRKVIEYVESTETNVSKPKKSKKKSKNEIADEIIPNEIVTCVKIKKSKRKEKTNELDDEEKARKKDIKKKKSKDSKTKLIDVDNLVLPDSSFMTCNQSARFGLGMSGKLARIQKLYDAEKLANQMKNASSVTIL